MVQRVMTVVGRLESSPTDSSRRHVFVFTGENEGAPDGGVWLDAPVGA